VEGDGVDWRGLNRANWGTAEGAGAPAGSFYDLAGFRAGAWDFDDFARLDWLVRREDGTFRFPPGEPRVPLVFSLRASAAGRRYATG
jgi:hypothetical protein